MNLQIKISKARHSLLALTLLMPSQLNLELLGGQNVKNIGRCNLGQNNIMDFSDPLYEEDTAKCKWSKFCEASWEGIDHLCV